ncbi:hypothetical protein [Streptomyces sp. NPDC001985]|uniref:hypothetical protein n=1 Tax=Streptomyces sp. NPDC001985 TaxID=3154406 RepID=UPI003329B00B
MATGAAVTLTWWGVHTVMSGTAYDRPRAVAIDTDAESTEPEEPQASSTKRPRSAPPKTASERAPETADRSEETVPGPTRSSAGGTVQGNQTPMSSSPSASAASTSNVKPYTVDGGRVVLDLGKRSAELVSATPNAGWTMDVWKEPWWIRVTFTKDGREVSVFCTWHAGPPTVVFDDR